MQLVSPHYLFAERPPWAILFWLGFAGLFFVSSLAQRRDRTGAKGENRDRGSKVAIYLFSFAAFGCAFWAPAVLPQAHIALPAEVVFAAAMAALWSGLLLYSWAVQTLGAFFRTSVTLLDGQKLVTKGPYRLLRHPAYTGGILIFSGIGIATGNWVSAIGSMLLVTLAYAWRIHVEERALSERFGAEFEAQRRRTWAVIPLVW